MQMIQVTKLSNANIPNFLLKIQVIYQNSNIFIKTLMIAD